MAIYLAAGIVVVCAAFVGLVYWQGRRAGATAVEHKVEAESREALERIDEARANAPKSKADTVSRLRKGDF